MSTLHARNSLSATLPTTDEATVTPSRPMKPHRLLHTMLRVRDLDRALAFYTGLLGMRLLRLRHFPEGRFTLAFVGYGDESTTTVIELTHNWDKREYAMGTAFGHVAVEVTDIVATSQALAAQGTRLIRPAGPLAEDPSEWIAFLEDPDGYRVELIQRGGTSEPGPANPSTA